LQLVRYRSDTEADINIRLNLGMYLRYVILSIFAFRIAYMQKKSSNTSWHNSVITRSRREELHNHKGVVIWFTGLSGSGKSTLAHALEERLYSMGCRTFVLDGDNVRHGLCSDLGFSNLDRAENIRRVGEIAKLFLEAGSIVLTAFISPFEHDRKRVKNLVPPGDLIEIYCHCSLQTCEDRDVKGLYKRARLGEIAEFTGISSPYEVPESPSLIVDTELLTLENSVEMILEFLRRSKIIKSVT